MVSVLVRFRRRSKRLLRKWDILVRSQSRLIQDNEFHSAGIELKRVPEGSKGKDHSRDIAVLTGMGVWIAVNRDVSSSIMLISDSIYDFAVEEFKKVNHYVLWKKLSAKGKPIAQTRRYSKR